MKILKVLFKVFKILFVVLSFCIMIFTIITVKNADKGEKEFFGHKMFIVLSDSMKPEFSAGDIIICKMVNPDDLKKGDIITFYSSNPNSTIITHQIIDITETHSKKSFITKGVNVDQVDEFPAFAFNVLGKYSFSIPKAGYFFNFFEHH